MAFIDTPGRPMSRWASLLLAIAPVVAASLIGSAATLPNIPSWYMGLAKPAFTPPNWLFGPVWTTLYVLMALACYRVLRTPAPHGPALTAFLVQITLNALWSVAFFGARSPLLGLVVIAPLWVAIAWTMRLFWSRDRIAGACFAPYLVWVSYAALLNFEVWRLNG